MTLAAVAAAAIAVSATTLPGETITVGGVGAAGARLAADDGVRGGGASASAGVVPVGIHGDAGEGVPLPATFASFGWEMYGMLGLQDDMRNPAFAKAASHLAPAVVRVGGISADWVRYTGFNSRDGADGDSKREPPTTPTAATVAAQSLPLPRRPAAPPAPFWPTEERNFTVADFDLLHDFFVRANLSLMFDLNELYGRDCHTPKPDCPTNPGCQAWCKGKWDTSNVETFLRYLHDKGLVGGHSPLYAFEVGNELISHEYASNTTADMIKLAALIQSVWSDVAPERRPGLYGPSTDACQDAKQLEIITNISGVQGIAGFTYHGYPAHGGTGANNLTSLLLNASWLRHGILTATASQACIDTWSGAPRKAGLALLVTEASSSYAWNLPEPAQDSVLHTLFTVAELGQYATTGVSLVARWAFSEHSPFATIKNVGFDKAANRTVYRVAADYWVILAHKATVGPKALVVDVPDGAPAVAYAYCGRHGNGSVVLAVSNPSDDAVEIQVSGVPGAASSSRLEYVFTAPGGNLSSAAPVLNGGATLAIEPDGGLPAAFRPAYRAGGSGGLTGGFTGGLTGGLTGVVVPPRAAAHYVLLDAVAPACKAQQ